MELIKIFLIIIFFLILYKIACSGFSENFFDFQNIPKDYGENINNIEDTNEIGLPKIIHHIAPNDFKFWDPKWFICYESWIRLYPSPEYKHMHWDNEELDDFIRENYPWFLEIYRGYDVNIKRYDIARLFLLYHYGGIYADMDYIVYKNFYNELPQDKISIPESPYKWNEHIQNSLMMGPPKANFWLICIDECYRRVDWNVFSATGPQLLTPMYFKYPDLVNVLPWELYNPDVYDETTYDTTKIYAKHLLSTVWQKE
jgi:mannosyltransferase OCH1-like enzyme